MFEKVLFAIGFVYTTAALYSTPLPDLISFAYLREAFAVWYSLFQVGFLNIRPMGMTPYVQAKFGKR